jgi:hypothetical protein
MTVQKIELEEVQMVETTDEALEAAVTVVGRAWTGMACTQGVCIQG